MNLATWFSARAAATPQRPALTFEGTTWTYAELDDRVRRLGRALREGGVSAGDRVAFLGHNQPQMLEGLFASAAVGASYLPLNFRCTGPEIAYMLADAGVHTVIADDVHRPVIDEIRQDVPGLRRAISSETGADGWDAWSDALRCEPLVELAPAPPDECAVIMYTSGTTGRPKGAMLSHLNLWWSNLNVLTTMDVLRDDVTLVVAPLFHIGGLNVTTLVTLIKGGRLVIHRAFEPSAALQAITTQRVTTMFGVPAMFQFMAADQGFAAADLSSVRFFVCGGAPLPESLIRTYLQRGIDFSQGYGLTETAPMVAFLTPEYALEKLGSTGRDPMFCEVEILSPEGAVISEAGVVGEICARGPNVTMGYYGNPEATRQAFDSDGWFHTGDGGHRDDDGFLYVSDRIKDMIISGGENIYPAEVESVLFDHPAVAEAAVIGIPDDDWGESVCAVVAVVRGTEAPTLEDVREFVGSRLARYKLPKRLEIVEALPRNPTGKVLKVELRDRFR